jgi:quinol monooxygenase YgiN
MPLIRIVKMSFKPDNTETFQEIFDERKEQIAGYPGCEKVELLRSGDIFFTYSVWRDEEALESYRNSALFNATWALVKPLFAAKAEAWSAQKLW